MDIFKIEQLTYSYPNQETESLKDISLSIKEGEFVLLTGPSGGGKSTLARLLSGFIPDFYGGTIQGNIFFKNQSMLSFDRKAVRRQVGMVFQDPERQIIMGQVERDVALGLENLGMNPSLMARRVTETLNFLGLTRLRDQPVEELSSGQKQKTAIGSILAMMPRVMILDEPASQLDPLAAQEILGVIERLNREHGMTIVLIEHRLDHSLPLAHRVILMDNGQIVLDERPSVFVKEAVRSGYEDFTPVVSRLFAAEIQAEIPLTVGQARSFMQTERSLASSVEKENVPKVSQSAAQDFLEIRRVHFVYRAHVPILEDIDFSLSAGECLAVLGENGAGKSTLLKLTAGILKPSSGKIFIRGAEVHKLSVLEQAKRIVYLGQNPSDYLFNDTVEQELLFTMRNFGIADPQRVEDILKMLDIQKYARAYPRDLSVGERQRVALAAMLAAQPWFQRKRGGDGVEGSLILLDEPTRGLDERLKKNLGITLRKFTEGGLSSVILVTQDVDFAAEFADRVILLSEGRRTADGRPEEVFDGNLFYSTQINKLFQGIVDGVVHFEQARKALKYE